MGPSYIFDVSKELALNALGTDWQMFRTYAEYKLHRQQVHHDMLPEGDWAEAESDCQCWGIISRWA